MDIRYVERSKFLELCESALVQQADRLSKGHFVNVELPAGGYPGKVLVTVKDDGGSFFYSDWSGTDPSRFPARVRAAATALKACRCFGSYEVSHVDGYLSIRMKSGPA